MREDLRRNLGVLDLIGEAVTLSLPLSLYTENSMMFLVALTLERNLL